jgi:outer membrane protein TolC
MVRWTLPLFLAASGLAGCHVITPAGRDVEARIAPVALSAPVDDIQQTACVATDQTSSDPSAIPHPESEQVIGLTEALARAGIENPTIALAEEAVLASEALRMQARGLLLPTLNAGTNVRVHQDTLLSSSGLIRAVNIQSAYVGAGAFAVGAGTVETPGVRLISHLGDAFFEPQLAEQRVIGRQFDALDVRHRTLLEVATRYLSLAGAQAEADALHRSQEDVGEIARLTANFAKAGQGRDSDAQRARSQLLLLQTQTQQAEERVAVAAAELARLLDLDPSVRLRPADDVPPLIEIINPAVALPALLQTAFANHPELAARSADVAAAQIRVRQEQLRPWLPILSAGLSAGSFGGAGSQAPTPSWSSGARMDFDVYAVWSLQNLGLGNRAVQNRARAYAGEAEAERARVADRIRTEVGEAYALALARRREIDIARQRIKTAHRAFAADLLLTKNLDERRPPIEVLRSANLLTDARLDLVRAMVGYSQAQLRLYVAMGNSPR